jgi:hypothetical protein
MKRKQGNNSDRRAELAEMGLEASRATLAAGVAVLQGQYGWTDDMSAIWSLRTAILLNEHLGIGTDELKDMLAELIDERT